MRKKSDSYYFVFKYALPKIRVDHEMYSDDEQEEILKIVNYICKDITIDKSYVDYEGTKYKKTFMLEEGWNELCHLIKITNFGKKCTKDQNDTLMEIYATMICCYVYLFLEDMDYDVSGIHVDMPVGSMFMVLIYKDIVESYKYYKGLWQSW